jgi:hypothetical protein
MINNTEVDYNGHQPEDSMQKLKEKVKSQRLYNHFDDLVNTFYFSQTNKPYYFKLYLFYFWGIVTIVSACLFLGKTFYKSKDKNQGNR